MKRRDFFKHTTPLMAAPMMLNSTIAQAFTSFDLFNSLNCETVQERFLVVIRLNGGNDGLNMIIRPEFDSLYAANRANIHIPQAQLLSSSDSAYNGIKFHPSMGEIRDLSNKGCLNVIQSAGYPSMNRSHFKATDLWLTGGDGTRTPIPGNQNNEDSSNISEGWMGLYLEHIFEGYNGRPSPFMLDPLGIQLRNKNLSQGLYTNSGYLAGVNLGSKSGDYYSILTEQGITAEFLEDSSCGDALGYIETLDRDTQIYGSRIQEVFDRGQNSSANYPDHDLCDQLRTVARLVNGGSKTKVFLTELSGFDTHVEQLGNHATLMTRLSESVHAFMDDLDKMGVLDRCLIVTFSEFGRKFKGNGSNGTDHGTLAPMLVFGHPDMVNSGITGPHIDVTNLDGGGAPKVEANNYTDYRDVFTSILNQWLGAELDTLDTAFAAYTGGQTLNLIKTGSSAANISGCYYEGQYDNPNVVNVSIPTVDEEANNGDYVYAAITGGGVDTEPLHEITACDYVDLKDGFWAKCGTNVIVYPFDCSANNGNNARIAGTNNTENTPDEILYTQQQQVNDESRLVEVAPTFERIKIKLFPNPAKDVVNVSFIVREGEQDIQLELLDAKGSIVPVRVPNFSSRDKEINIQLDISHVPAGVYYVRYVSRAMIETFKVIVL